SRMKKLLKPIALITFSLLVFFGISIKFKITEDNKKENLLKSLSNLKIEIGGLEELKAGTSSSWAFVRGSATWGRSNSTLVDGILKGLQDSGIFTRISSGELVVPNQTLSSGVSVTYRVKINENVTGLSSTAYSGTKDFSHRFEIWKTGDNSAPILQMFFSSTTSTGTNGVLLYYNLSKINPTTFGTATSAVVESYTSGTTGNMAQTYSWKNGPEDSTWISKNGRVIIRQMNSGAEICVRTVVELNRGTTGIGTNLDTLCATSNSVNNTSNKLFYTLAYVQKTTSPFYTVAKAGLVKKEAAPIKNKTTFCGYSSSVSSALPASYGLFDQNGFVSDGATTVPSGYPATSDVDAAFSRTGAAKGDTGTDSITVADYDQSDATFMENLASNATLAFKTTTAPASCSQSFCIN
ncbi:MAG: hypothetical protein KDK36_15660, partial [Leptospiraceae bacterium]|nr:hypothetical protein [Leptospiraceae bacterium]